MHWYDGSIAEAVTLSKQRNSIFVVFVEGDNDLSQEMASTLDEAAVQKRLADPDNFLAVKLKSGSETYVHFARMYQFVPVPSVFFIGRNGTPLEVVCAGVQPEDLATRMDRILVEHQKGKPPGAAAPAPPAMEPSTSGQNIRQQTASLIQSESAQPDQTAKTREREEEPETSAGPASKVPKRDHREATASGRQYDVVCDSGVCVRVPKRDDSGPSTSSVAPAVGAPTPPVPMDQSPPAQVTVVPTEASEAEKVERAKQLIEMKRREKAEQEKELERKKELERRSTGQGVAELKRWQADQEMKQLQDERRREKLENQQARQRVLDQIAQDRAERRARETTTGTPAAELPTPSAATTSAQGGDGGARARIQFKLPDGTSHTAHFQAEEPLSNVQRYVADNLQLTPSSFTLWTAFPRRELTNPDCSLRDLELVPSAALLVMSRRAASSAPVAHSGTLQTLLSLLSQLMTTILSAPGTLWSWFWGAPPAGPSGSGGPARGRGAPAPPAPPPGMRYRPQSNIHRLTGDHDRPADDDNNTWNGNSTQQM